MAGSVIPLGLTYGATGELGYNVDSSELAAKSLAVRFAGLSSPEIKPLPSATIRNVAP